MPKRISKRNWTFLTSHAVVFLHIVQNPCDTIRRIADEVNLAERTVASILADLREDGYISVTKKGKTNFYALDPDLPMRNPLHAQHTVRDFFGPLEIWDAQSADSETHHRRRTRSG
jgi:hypothetical protein